MKEVRWHGRGGQGAKSISMLLARAQMDGGRYVQAFPEYGPERSGAPMCAYNRSDTRPIRLHCGVTHPDCVIVLDESLLDEVSVSGGVRDNGFVMVNSPKSSADIADKINFAGTIYTVEGDRIATENNIQFANVVMVGALARVLGNPKLDYVNEAVTEMFGKKLSEEVLQQNIEAIEDGYEAISNGHGGVSNE